jgi:hypothetical protein
VALTEIADEFRTPTYVIDEADFRHRIRRYSARYPPFAPWRALSRSSQPDPSSGWSNALNEPDYTSMREPMITVRSRGKPKCSTASAVICDVAMNRYLRHRGISGAAPTTSSMLDRK